MSIKKITGAVITFITAIMIAVIPVSAKTVVKNMLPDDKGWSSEGTLNPIKTEEGWKLKTSPTMDGGSAVAYFDATYHKGMKIAYDFTIVGDDDANVTVYIGFIRGLESSVYPNGKEGYHFTHYLAKSIGIEPTGEDGDVKATIPGGTYKGVLDLGDFFYDGFDKFQHVAFYVGGEEAIIREFAFVESVEAGAETYPKAESKPDNSVKPDDDKQNTAPAEPDNKTGESDNENKNESNKNNSSSESESSDNVPSQYMTVIIVISAVGVLCLAAVAVMAVILIKNKKRSQ